MNRRKPFEAIKKGFNKNGAAGKSNHLQEPKLYFQQPKKLLRPATAEQKFKTWQREQERKASRKKKLAHKPHANAKSQKKSYQEKLQLENFIKMRYHTYLSERYQYLEAEEESKRAQTAPSPSRIKLKKLNKKAAKNKAKFKSRTLEVLPRVASVARLCSEGDEPRDIKITEVCLQTLEFLLLGEDAVLGESLIQTYLVDIIREIRRGIYSSRVGVPVVTDPTEEDNPSSVGCAPFFEVVDFLQQAHDDHVVTVDKLRSSVQKLTKELEKERETVAKLKYENGQLKYRVMHVEKDNKRLTRDFKFVQSSYIRTSEEFRNIQAKTIDLNGQLDTSQIKLENANAKAASLENTQRHSEETIDRLKNKIQDLRDLVSEIYEIDPSMKGKVKNHFV